MLDPYTVSWHLPVLNAAILVMSYLFKKVILQAGCTDMPQSCGNIFYLHGNFTAVGDKVISSIIPLLYTLVTPLVTYTILILHAFFFYTLHALTYCRFVFNTN
jgi:hypothetical protein